MSLAELKTACRNVASNCNKARFETFECFLCSNRMTGAEQLQRHFSEFHQIKLESVHNFPHLSQLLAHLQQLVHKNSDNTAFSCPVCQAESASLSTFSQHLTSSSHSEWTVKHIASLRDFMFDIVKDEGDTSSDSESEGDNDDVQREEEDDTDDDDEAEPTIRCLYCTAELDEHLLDAHFTSAHGLVLQKYVQEHASVITNEYDLIRMINAVRDALKTLTSPVDPKVTFASAEEWAMYVQTSQHYFPLTVPEGENYLIPRIPADPLISYVMEAVEFSEALPEEDFPMVDTLQQHIVKKQEIYAAKARENEAE